MSEHIFKRFHGFDNKGNPFIHHHCLEESKGQANWVSIFAFGRDKIMRQFLKRNRLGTLFLVPPYLKVGDTLEFGADKITNKYRYIYREYWMVEERTETCLNLSKMRVTKERKDLCLLQDR